MRYIIKIQKYNNQACFIALCDKTRALKIITEFWPKFDHTKYKIIIEKEKINNERNTYIFNICSCGVCSNTHKRGREII